MSSFSFPRQRVYDCHPARNKNRTIYVGIYCRNKFFVIKVRGDVTSSKSQQLEMVVRFPLTSIRVTTSAADILPFLAWDSDHPSPLSAFHFFRRLNRLDKRRNKGRGDTQAAASLSNLLCLCNLFIYFNNGISKFPATNLSKSTDKIIFHFSYIMYIIRVVVKRLNFFRDGDRITREKYHNRNNNQNCIIPLGKIK